MRKIAQAVVANEIFNFAMLRLSSLRCILGSFLDISNTARLQPCSAANGDLDTLDDACALAAVDFRDPLWASSLGQNDWPTQLDEELGA